jgi:serine phosphatase RsbU (regulator of sigma subunit)
MAFTGEEIESVRGDMLFIYSDGLNEAENQQQEQFGDTRLIDILGSKGWNSAREVVESMKTQVEAHRAGAEPNDDLSMLCLKFFE